MTQAQGGTVNPAVKDRRNATSGADRCGTGLCCVRLQAGLAVFAHEHLMTRFSNMDNPRNAGRPTDP